MQKTTDTRRSRVERKEDKRERRDRRVRSKVDERSTHTSMGAGRTRGDHIEAQTIQHSSSPRDASIAMHMHV